MKLSGLFLTMLLCIAIITAWLGIVADFETNYIDTNISSAEPMNETFNNTFISTAAINESVSALEEDLRNIEEANTWWEKLVTGAVAIPGAIINFVGLIIDLGLAGITGLTALLKALGVPIVLVGISAIAFMLYLLFKLVAFWRRTPV